MVDDGLPIYGDGSQTRSFCYVSDTVRALLSLLTDPKAKGETVNIGNPQEITILELGQLVKELIGSNSQIAYHPLPEDDPKRRCPDIGKASRLLGWKPRVPIKEGLACTLEWLRSIDVRSKIDS